MGVSEFMSLFAQYVSLGTWTVNEMGFIRSGDNQCPVCFVNYHHNPDDPCRKHILSPWDTKLGKLLSGKGTLGIVINAADNTTIDMKEVDEQETATRKQMLELCKLTN